MWSSFHLLLPRYGINKTLTSTSDISIPLYNDAVPNGAYVRGFLKRLSVESWKTSYWLSVRFLRIIDCAVNKWCCR